jgi:hypothetical protein
VRKPRPLLLVAAVAAVAVVPAASVSAAGAARKPIPDVTVLIPRAVAKVRATDRPTFAGAQLFEADGMTPGGRCTPMGCSGGRAVRTAAGIIEWRFVFGVTHSRFESATLFYGPAPKRFGRVTGFKAPFTEDVVITRAPRMSLAQAVALLRRAGYHQAFFNVSLRNPLGPRRSNPLYIFGFRNSFVAVNTVTRKVGPFA